MAHVWIQDEENGWEAWKIAVPQVKLAELFSRAHVAAEHAGDAGRSGADESGVQLMRVGANGTQVWALLASTKSNVRVNGKALLANICVLSDRDHIRVGPTECFFSTETLPVPEALSSERPLPCPRCQQGIAPGAVSVCCPRCGVFYHQDQEANLRCWDYDSTCRLCGYPTNLEAAFQWKPEED